MNVIESKLTESIDKFTKIIYTKNNTKICLVYETYTNGELTEQFFKPPKPFHIGYEPERMVFYYYEKLPALTNNDGWYKTSYVNDLDSFDEFDKLYCPWFSMDNNLYQFTKKYPVCIPISYDLWGINHDLEAAKKHLEKQKGVSDVIIKDNIYSNYEISGRQVLYFKYCPTPNMQKKISECHDLFSKKQIVKSKLGLDRFKTGELY